MSPRAGRVRELVAAVVLLFVAVVPAYYTWRAVRLTGANQHAGCTVTNIQSSRTVESSGGKQPYDVFFRLELPDGRSFDGEDLVWAGSTMPTAFGPGQRVLCFHVPGRPDLLVLEPPSLVDWLLPAVLTFFCLGTAGALLLFGNRPRGRG